MKQNKLQKNLFKKYIVISGVFTLLCLIIFGIVITSYFSNFWINEQYTTLERNANSVSRQVGFMNKQGLMDSKYLSAVAAEGGEIIDGYIFVTSRNGKVLASNIADTSVQSKQFPEWMVRNSIIGKLHALSDLNGMLKNKCFFSSSVVVDSDNNIVGVVFAGVSASGHSRYIGKLLIIFISVSVLIMLMVVAGVYVIASQMVRPLREMGAAARRMANGDYSKKIKVTRNDEIGQLEEAFNEMSESVSRTEISRRGFMANVSHELKTPLTTISGFIDGILDGTIDSKDTERYLNIVSGEVKRMNALVMSMFNLSRLESGAMKPDFKEIDPSKTIVSVLLSFENRINSKNIDIEGLDCLESFTVNADEGLFHQAIYNLVDNAVKFTDDGGYISVFCDEKDGKVSVRIRNSGKGIAMGELPKVFDRFYKSDASRSADKTGAGLGLSLVKTVVDLHSGSITVRSVEGSYTEFEIRLDKAGVVTQVQKPHRIRKNNDSKTY